MVRYYLKIHPLQRSLQLTYMYSVYSASQGRPLLEALQFSKQLALHPSCQFSLTKILERQGKQILERCRDTEMDAQRRPITCPGSYNWLIKMGEQCPYAFKFLNYFIPFSHDDEKFLVSQVGPRQRRLHCFLTRGWSLAAEAPCSVQIFAYVRELMIIIPKQSSSSHFLLLCN